MNPPHIKVSYNGDDRTVPLAVQPSIELSDGEVEEALTSLQSLLRKSFSLLPDDTFYLFEAEKNRTMTQESFREPSYCLHFPGHWYLVVNKNNPGSPYSRQPTKNLPEDLGPSSMLDLDSSHLTDSYFRDTDIAAGGGMLLPTLEEMGEHAKYHSYTIRGPGQVGCTLRHFSIAQASSSKYSDLLMSESVTGRRVSLVSCDSQDKLSTTFVGSVEPGSEAEKAGLREGFVVHMIDQESILRSDIDEIQRLIEQCGVEMTLLGLPKDTDDLQYMYSKYTEGPAGVVTMEEGQVTVVDVPLVLGTNAPAGHTPNHTHQSSCPSPPEGMVPFEQDAAESPTNSLSDADPLLMGIPRTKLIEGSLMDIWSSDRQHRTHKGDACSPTSSRNSVPQLDQLDEGTSSNHAHSGHQRSDRNNVHEEADVPWYIPDSGRGLDSNRTKPSPKTPRSNGRIRGSVKGSDREAGYGGHDSEEQLELAGLSNGQLSDGSSPYTSSSHNHTPSDASQYSNRLNGSRGQLSTGQLSGQSCEEFRVPGDGACRGSTADLKRSTSTTSNSGQKKALHGYKSKRELLHKGRSKKSLTDVDGAAGANQTDGKTAEQRYSRGEESVPIVNGHGHVHDSSSGRLGTLIHANSVDHDPAPRIPQAAHLPLSKADSAGAVRTTGIHTSNPRLQFVPVASPGPPDTLETNLVTTEEGEQYREVDIEEAIRKSQGGILSLASQSHTHSVDDQLDESKARTGPFARYKSLEPSSGTSIQSRSSHVSSDLMATVRVHSPTYRPEVICRGLLAIKHEGGGRRGQDRGWREYYAVLAGTTLKFYKDKKDSFFGNLSDETPLEVVPATVEVEPKGVKKKHVFRLVTAQGASCLLQADDAPNKQRWVHFIQDLNDNSDQDTGTTSQGGSRYPRGFPSPPQKSRYLLPPSPTLRRMSSPVTSQTLPSTSRSTGGIFNRIRKTLTRQPRDNDLDYSSFTTFQQPLHNCPVSPDNKRVPLVVEFCVSEVEKHGLKVEGIYRKPGLVAMINQMSGQMDRGHYMFDYNDYGQDVHTVASLLKKFLKELPDPLIPDSMYQLFLDCARQRDETIRLNTLKELVFRLPTAHYHTLRFLIRHLVTVSTHSEHNKMSRKNVALVFGPTLMRSAADDMLTNMSAGYTIVELLCSYEECLFEEELCMEEQEAAKEVDAVAMEDEELLTKGTAGREVEVQKESVKNKLSPQSLRRTKDSLSRGGSLEQTVAMKRHSTHAESSLKISTWTGSGPLSHTDGTRGHLRASLSSLQTPPTDGEISKKRVVRHAYEDVELLGKNQGADDRRKQEDSRTVSWVNHHREMNWGRPNNSRAEVTGSLWSNKNREQQLSRATSRDKLRQGQVTSGGRARKQSQSSRDEESRDFFSSYQGSSPQVSYHQHSSPLSSASSSSVVPQPQSYGSTHRQQSVPSPSSGKPRRISYMSAMNEPADIPVRETAGRRKDHEERFSASEHVPSRHHQHGSGSMYSRDGWKMEGAGHSRYAHTSSSHTQQQRASKYNTLQQDFHQAPPTMTGHSHALTRRRSSDAMENPLLRQNQGSASGSRHYYQQQRNVSRDNTRPHRTYSNDRTYNVRGGDSGNSPPHPILNPYQGSPDAHIPSLLHSGHAHSTSTPGESYI